MATVRALIRAPGLLSSAPYSSSSSAIEARQVHGSSDRIVCGIQLVAGLRASATGRRQQQLSRNKNATASLSATSCCAAKFNGNSTRRSTRASPADVEVELIEESVRKASLNSLDLLEKSFLQDTKFTTNLNQANETDDLSIFLRYSPARGVDISPWIKNGKECISNLFAYIFQQSPSRLMEGDRLAATAKFAVIASIIGLQACSQAWAGPEIARADVNSSFFGDLSDVQNGFASAFLLIFFSEIGDKTFFIAALLATRKPGAAVFSGTFGALTVMTLISVVLGRAFHYVDELLPRLGETKIPVDDLAAVVLLVYFGVSTLIEAASMEESKQEGEQQEAELAIAGVGANGAIAGTVAATFALVFVAEWGDKSFFSTIALAAASSPLGVVAGAIGGHGAATLLAVLGGSFLGNYVSEKVIAYIGGSLFLVFAGITLVEILN